MADTAHKELAEQFAVMRGLSAWKHVEMILARIEEQATKEEDDLPLEELTMVRIAECRGRRKAIEKVLRDIEYLANGPK